MFTAQYLYLATGEMLSNNLCGFTLGVASSLRFLGAWVISFPIPCFINPTGLNQMRVIKSTFSMTLSCGGSVDANVLPYRKLSMHGSGMDLRLHTSFSCSS